MERKGCIGNGNYRKTDMEQMVVQDTHACYYHFGICFILQVHKRLITRLKRQGRQNAALVT
jgi:hypothetical protein